MTPWTETRRRRWDAMDAIEHLERAVTHARVLDGIVLRYGTFYGPGTTLSECGEHLEQIRHRRFPLVGEGNGVWSFGHIDDAATATMDAIERGAPGIYNVVDDEPARVAEWLQPSQTRSGPSLRGMRRSGSRASCRARRASRS